MERPQSILGLATHAARLRWQALSPRGRFIAIGVGAMMTGTALFGVKMATGDCCCNGCDNAASAQDTPCHGGR
jgi:hypothetical protein